MLIKRNNGWAIPERSATPEGLFLSRRQVVAGMGFAGLSVLAGSLPMPRARAQNAVPTADLYPAARNEAFEAGRAITDESIASTYNNFYEFGSHKQIWRAAQELETRPWEITIDGLVEEPIMIDVDDLVRRMGVEERIYRLRCVEAWSMVVPWTGFPLARLVEMARPLGSARYLRMQTFQDSDVARGQRQVWYPWPYTEGLTIEEATNDLAFMVTGAYGKVIDESKQFGAPIRLHVPWKYGFKSIKSITRFEFVEERPETFWSAPFAGGEYGFWANVNPEVPHRRWSQASERVVGTEERIPTELFNGYGEWVADLYSGLEGEDLYT